MSDQGPEEAEEERVERIGAQYDEAAIEERRRAYLDGPHPAEEPQEAVLGEESQRAGRRPLEALEMNANLQAGAGIAQAHGGENVAGRRRGQGRRVALVRQRDGGYGIWMGGRLVQSFCNEWEDITNFQLPEGFEQQIRVNCQIVGEAREVTSERDQSAPPQPETMRDPWDGADLVGLFSELPVGAREQIARMITDAHRQVHGVALQSIAHPRPETAQDRLAERGLMPPRNEQLSVVGQLREALHEVLRVVDRL